MTFNKKRFMMAGGLLLLILAVALPFSGRLAQAGGNSLSNFATQLSIGTGFSYQGYLADNGVPVNGSCHFRFELWNDEVAGSQVGSADIIRAVPVTDGNFAVILNDSNEFGDLAFHGQARWLEIAVNCDNTDFTTLNPRQHVYPTPYAFSLVPGAIIRDDLDESIVTISNASDDIDGVGLTVFSVMDGIHVNASRAGIVIDEADFIGVHIKESGDDALQIDTAAVRGVRINQTGADGVSIVNAGTNGVEVGSSGQDGFQVVNAGDDGFQVNTATNDGVVIGSAGQDGVHINSSGNDGVEIESAGNHGLRVAEAGATGVSIGNAGTHGVFVQSANNGSGVFVSSATFDGIFVDSAGNRGGTFRGENAGIYARSGSDGNPDIILGGNSNTNDGDNGRIVSPPNYPDSDFYITSNDAVVVELNADGAGDADNDFEIRNADDNVIFRVDEGGRTTVEVLEITGGSDLAELFEVNAAANQAPEAGMVACLDAERPGQLVICHHANDTKVVGVISGAGGVAPGMIMGQDGSIADGDYPVAITGRVYVWVDASEQPVQVGDMLTTSETAGHAEKVVDHGAAQGAILGKAMTGLDSGSGLVLVLVTLQ